MENKNIAYIDYIDEEKHLKIFYKILKIFRYIKIKENLYILFNENPDNKYIDKLSQKILKSKMKNIVIASKLNQCSELVNKLKEKFYILDGSWLYKFLIIDILEKIAYIQKKKLENMKLRFCVIK